MPTLADIARLSTEEAAVVRVALPLARSRVVSFFAAASLGAAPQVSTC
jgi:hypothetical protein